MIRTKLYSVYVRADAERPLDTAILVKRGFSIPAFLLQGLWAIYNRTWLLAALVMVILWVLKFAVHAHIINLQALLALHIVFMLYIGASANDWLEAALEKRGYVLYDITAGKTTTEAMQRLLDRVVASTPQNTTLPVSLGAA